MFTFAYFNQTQSNFNTSLVFPRQYKLNSSIFCGKENTTFSVCYISCQKQGFLNNIHMMTAEKNTETLNQATCPGWQNTLVFPVIAATTMTLRVWARLILGTEVISSYILRKSRFISLILKKCLCLQKLVYFFQIKQSDVLLKM